MVELSENKEEELVWRFCATFGFKSYQIFLFLYKS